MWPLSAQAPPPAWPGLAEDLSGLARRIAALSLAIPLVRLALHSLALEPLARAVLGVPRGGGSSGASTSASTATAKHAASGGERLVQRWTESAWKLLAYSALTALALAALAGQEWAPWWSVGGRKGPALGVARERMWAWPGKGGSLLAGPAAGTAGAPAPPLAWYWAAEAAWYAASTLMLFTWEVRRSDFAAMAAHHFTTLALIGGSAAAGLERPGAAVMALHDPADVFLEAAKLASYAGRHGLATACFVALVLTWAVTRLGLLPLVAADAWRGGAAVRGLHPPIPAARPLATLLWVLVALHWYWFGLILRITVRQLLKGGGRVTRDVREEEDADAVEK